MPIRRVRRMSSGTVYEGDMSIGQQVQNHLVTDKGSDVILAGLALNERGLEAKIDARGLMPFTCQLLIEN